MEEKTEKVAVPMFSRNIAEVILNHEGMGRLRKWLLRKLIPEELWEAPTFKLGELAAGTVVTNIMVATREPDGSFDVGS